MKEEDHFQKREEKENYSHLGEIINSHVEKKTQSKSLPPSTSMEDRTEVKLGGWKFGVWSRRKSLREKLCEKVNVLT